MKDSMIIISLILASAFALVLIVPQVVTSWQPTSTVTPGYSGSSGMMGNMMGGGTMQGGMMGDMGMMQAVMGGPYAPDIKPISIEEAAEIAENYLTSLGNEDLAIEEVEEYSNNFYFAIHEKSTGIGVSQMLIDRFTGNVYPEPGPSMMWGTKSGMGGMMGGNMMGGMMQGGTMGGGSPTAEMPISKDQAKLYTEQFLASYMPGATVGEVHTFYGYYHMHVLVDGEMYGMLDVNGYSGQVWYHIWHGTFIQEEELH